MIAADELQPASDNRVSLEQDCENDIEPEPQIKNSVYSQDAMDEIDVDEHSSSIDSAELGVNRPSSFRHRDSGRSLCSSTSLGGGLASLMEEDGVDGTKKLMSEQEDSSLDTNEDDQFRTRAMWGMEAMLVAALEKREERKKRIVEMESNEQERREAIAHRKRKRLVHSAVFSATDGIVPADGIPNEIKMLAGDAGLVPDYKFASSSTDNSDKGNRKGDENMTPKLRNGQAGTNEKSTPPLSKRKLRLPKVVYTEIVAIGDWWKLPKGDGEGGVSGSGDKKEMVTVSEHRDEFSISVAPLSDLLPSKNENKIEDIKNSSNGETRGLNAMIAAAVAERQERIARTGIDATSMDVKSVAIVVPLASESCEDEIDKNNSDNGNTVTPNEMIAVAAEERQIQIAKPERSPLATKGKVKVVQSERDATSVTASIHSFSSSYNHDEDEEENSLMRKEMTISEMAITQITADTELKRERTKEKLMKAREEKQKQEQEKSTSTKHRVWKTVEYDAQQRKQDKDNHRKIFLSVVDEAATYGRLVRLEEKIVEGQGGEKFHDSNTWSGPKLLTDNRRSDALKMIQEAAAMGRMKQPKPEKDLSHTQDSDFIKNFVGNINNNQFDVDNQVDEHGQKILRTNFLLDQYVKKTAQGKKERMFADSTAIENRDHKTATYESFDDVQLPTDNLPTFKQILGPRSKLKKVSSASDLAVIKMQMSEKNLTFDGDEDGMDVEKRTNNRLRVLESISRDVAASACERALRLQKSKAQLKVTKKCFCPYCKDPNSYQTHKYKMLMYPERFLDDSDNNSYCQVVAETPDTTSNIAKVARNSVAQYAISPGGRKKKIIRVVRRRKKSGGGTLPTGLSLGVNTRVIDGSTLSPEQLDMLTEQLQKQGSNSLTTEELVQIADALKATLPSTSTVPVPTNAEESPNFEEQFPLSQQNQQVTNVQLSSEQVLKRIADSNDTTASSPGLSPEKSAYMDQLLEVANDLTIPNLPFMESNSNEDVDQSPDFNLPLDLLSLDVKLDSSSTLNLSSQDKPGKPTSKRKNKKSSKNHNRDHTKSPISRKSRRKVNADELLEGIGQSDANNPPTSTKTKNGRRRPKGLVQPQSGEELSPKAMASPTDEIPRKKSVRSKMKKLGRSESPRARKQLLSTSDKDKRRKKSKKSKSPRRGARRSLSPKAGHESMSVLNFEDILDIQDVIKTPKPPRRIKSLGNPKLHRPASSILESEIVEKTHKSNVEKPRNRTRRSKDLTEADLPRSGRRNVSKTRKPKAVSRLEQQKPVKSATISDDEDYKWQPVRRIPSRTKSLPISPGTKEKGLLKSCSSEEDQSIQKNPTRTFSFQDQLRRSNNFVANLISKRKKLSKSQPDELLISLSPSRCSPSNSNGPKALSPEQRQRVYEFLTSKNYPLPPSPQTPKNAANVEVLNGDLLKNSVQFNKSTTIPEEDSEPPSPQTPRNEVNVEAPGDDLLKKPLHSNKTNKIPEEGTDSTTKSSDISFSDLSNATQQQDHQRLVKNTRRSTSLDRRGIQKTRGRGQKKSPRRNKKANVVEVTKIDINNRIFNIEDLPPKPSISFRLNPVQEPAKQPRRCHSVDRVRIMKQKGRGESSRKLKSKDGSEKGKKKKNFKLKNWLKKGGKTE